MGKLIVLVYIDYFVIFSKKYSAISDKLTVSLKKGGETLILQTKVFTRRTG